MGVLHNPQHERFARELVELELACDRHARSKAYERAGYLPSPSNARRLANTPKVKARVAALFAEACEYSDIRAASVVVRIDRVGRANLADFFEADGRTLKNIKTLPRELTDALESIEWVADGEEPSGTLDDDGTPLMQPRMVPKIRLHDKNQANFTLLKHFGGLPEAAPAAQTTNIFNVLSVDDQQALAAALEALPAGPPATDHEPAREHREG